MNYRVIEYDSWPRRGMFEFFASADQPFYNLGYRLDVTKVYNFAKKNDVSFYLTLTYLVTKAINSVEAFRYAIIDGEIVLFDELIPSFTDLRPGSEHFHIVTMPCEGGIIEFCRAAKKRSMEQDGIIDQTMQGKNLIYISSVPWLDLTALSNERHFDRDDAIPRIAWGRFVDDGCGHKELGMTMELNHRFIDGFYIGKFNAELCRLIDALE
jgi:chloramphenicol O-acetyltransferase type A